MRTLALLTVMCIGATACANPQRTATATVPAGTDWSTVACIKPAGPVGAALHCATMRQWHDAMQANGKSKSAIATTLVVLANLPPGPTGAPTAYLPPDRPAPAPTYASAPTYDVGSYAGPSILSERGSAVDDDDGPPPPPSARTFMTMPMGNGATIIAGDINGIALPMGNGTLWSFE